MSSEEAIGNLEKDELILPELHGLLCRLEQKNHYSEKHDLFWGFKTVYKKKCHQKRTVMLIGLYHFFIKTITCLGSSLYFIKYNYFSALKPLSLIVSKIMLTSNVLGSVYKS